MTTTKLFMNNRTQAVRLPRDVAFPDSVHDVEITVRGETRVITPVGGRWKDWAANRTTVSDDFMAERDQGVAEERDW